ncbi:MAG: hypothetical protein F7B11_04825 [Caldisphaeraceae archaeon]|nr:hypothetical protein [Caldisphaeraceae archaeon]
MVWSGKEKLKLTKIGYSCCGKTPSFTKAPQTQSYRQGMIKYLDGLAYGDQRP